MALADPRVPFHSDAVNALKLLRGTPRRRLTTNYVVVETVALLHNRFGIAAVRTFADELLPIADIIWVTPAVHSLAINSVTAGGRRGPSMVDCVSFEVMRQHGITEALAFDRHFTESGYSFPT